MATILVGQVLERWPGRESLQMLIAVILADAADADGSNVYPSVERVARLARCGTRSVQYALRDFVKAGFLVMEHPGGGRGRPAKYRIIRSWLEAQESALEGFRKNSATDASISETVHEPNLTAQIPCTNPANSLHQPVHPTQQPRAETRKAAAASTRQEYRQTHNGIVMVPGNVLDEIGLAEIERLESEHPGVTERAVREVLKLGKRPFVSPVLANAMALANAFEQEEAKKRRSEVLADRQRQVLESDPEVIAVGDGIMQTIANRRAAKSGKEGCNV